MCDRELGFLDAFIFCSSLGQSSYLIASTRQFGTGDKTYGDKPYLED
jgi:hypothetical protein